MKRSANRIQFNGYLYRLADGDMGVIDDLRVLQADHMVFYQKLRNFHWNVSGDLFYELHKKFNELYDAAATDVDDLAERVRQMGGEPLRTMQDALSAARLQEDPEAPEDMEMASRVLADLEFLGKSMQDVVARLQNDAATRNLLEEKIQAGEKAAWMLRQFLGH